MSEQESFLQLKSEIQTLKIKDEYRSKELDALMVKLSDTSTKLNALSENIGRLLAAQDVNKMTDKEFREEMKILHTRIGDLQYHHFSFETTEPTTHIQVELKGEKDFDFCLYLKKDTPAFRSNADHAVTGSGNTKTISRHLTLGKWFVSVECTTTVKAELDGCRGFFNYSGKTSVLNGAAYRIKLVTAK